MQPFEGLEEVVLRERVNSDIWNDAERKKFSIFNIRMCFEEKKKHLRCVK